MGRTIVPGATPPRNVVAKKEGAEMGQNRAPHPSRGWIVRYIGGGPLDGGIRVKSEPIQGHHIPVEDGPFAGHQCYDLVGWSPEDQVIVLAYSGERWGPKLDDG